MPSSAPKRATSNLCPSSRSTSFQSRASHRDEISSAGLKFGSSFILNSGYPYKIMCTHLQPLNNLAEETPHHFSLQFNQKLRTPQAPQCSSQNASLNSASCSAKAVAAEADDQVLNRVPIFRPTSSLQGDKELSLTLCQIFIMKGD